MSAAISALLAGMLLSGRAGAAVPSPEGLAEAQLEEQEALCDARARRASTAEHELDEREKAALELATSLEQRERALGAREGQIDVRELRTTKRGPPTPQERQLDLLEAQLSAQERQLAAQERSVVPAIDAALGREGEAAARENAEHREAARPPASTSGAGSGALQIEIRKQALAARNRQFAALEARLAAKSDRIGALQRQLGAWSERLETWSRRLDTRVEQLDLLEKRSAEAARPKTADAKAGAAKAKAAFVMIVKSPTAIVKNQPGAQAAAASERALHPGVAIEKAVAAATVVTFPSASGRLSELDGETVESIARLAAKERCELLVWARASDPGLMAEAQRRATEIRTRAIAAGPLDDKQVVTRITTRPGAQGVDVVVSALRESTKGGAPAAPVPATPALRSGESGKRQLRELIVAAQPSIDACVGEQIVRMRLGRAEGALRLTVSAQGNVRKVATGGGDLAGTEIEECLTNAAAAWVFPSAEAEYGVEVPITVIRRDAAR